MVAYVPNHLLACTENVGVQLDDLMSFEYNNPVDRSKCLVDSKNIFYEFMSCIIYLLTHNL